MSGSAASQLTQLTQPTQLSARAPVEEATTSVAAAFDSYQEYKRDQSRESRLYRTAELIFRSYHGDYPIVTEEVLHKLLSKPKVTAKLKSLVGSSVDPDEISSLVKIKGMKSPFDRREMNPGLSASNPRFAEAAPSLEASSEMPAHLRHSIQTRNTLLDSIESLMRTYCTNTLASGSEARAHQENRVSAVGYRHTRVARNAHCHRTFFLEFICGLLDRVIKNSSLGVDRQIFSLKQLILTIHAFLTNIELVKPGTGAKAVIAKGIKALTLEQRIADDHTVFGETYNLFTKIASKITELIAVMAPSQAERRLDLQNKLTNKAVSLLTACNEILMRLVYFHYPEEYKEKANELASICGFGSLEIPDENKLFHFLLNAPLEGIGYVLSQRNWEIFSELLNRARRSVRVPSSSGLSSGLSAEDIAFNEFKKLDNGLVFSQAIRAIQQLERCNYCSIFRLANDFEKLGLNTGRTPSQEKLFEAMQRILYAIALGKHGEGALPYSRIFAYRNTEQERFFLISDESGVALRVPQAAFSSPLVPAFVFAQGVKYDEIKGRKSYQNLLENLLTLRDQLALHVFKSLNLVNVYREMGAPVAIALASVVEAEGIKLLDETLEGLLFACSEIEQATSALVENSWTKASDPKTYDEIIAFMQSLIFEDMPGIPNIAGFFSEIVSLKNDLKFFSLMDDPKIISACFRKAIAGLRSAKSIDDVFRNAVGLPKLPNAPVDFFLEAADEFDRLSEAAKARAQREKIELHLAVQKPFSSKGEQEEADQFQETEQARFLAPAAKDLKLLEAQTAIKECMRRLLEAGVPPEVCASGITVLAGDVRDFSQTGKLPSLEEDVRKLARNFSLRGIPEKVYGPAIASLMGTLAESLALEEGLDETDLETSSVKTHDSENFEPDLVAVGRQVSPVEDLAPCSFFYASHVRFSPAGGAGGPQSASVFSPGMTRSLGSHKSRDSRSDSRGII